MSRITLVVLALAAAAPARDLRVTTIAVSGDPAPGLPGLTFEFFSDPRLSAPGKIAFWADLQGPSVTELDNGSLWSDRDGSLALVLRENDPAPFAPDIRYAAFPYPVFTHTGRFGFTAALRDGAVPPPPAPQPPINLAIFNPAAAGPGFVPVAREGTQAVGLPAGVPWSGLAPVPMNDAGHRAFTAVASAGIWAGDPAGLALVIAPSSPAPGAVGLLFGAFQQPKALDAASTLAFSAALVDPQGSTQPVAQGIWRRDFGAPPVLVARSGAPVPGVSGATFAEVSAHPAVTAGFGTSRIIVYWARAEGGQVTLADDTGYWTSPLPPIPVPLVREGAPAPGAGAGVFFDGFSRHPALAADPGVAEPGFFMLAFRADLRGSGVSDQNNSGLWLRRADGFFLVARENDQVPRLPAGVRFASFSDPVINSRGQIVFLARLRGPSVTQDTSLALFVTEFPETSASSPPGRIMPVVRLGMPFVVAPGDERVVHEIHFDSRPPETGFSAHNDDGIIAFKLVFKPGPPPLPPVPPLAFRYTEGLFTARFRCLADVNGDGALNLGDFGAFQTAFALNDHRRADFDGDGVLTLADFGSFQTAFAQGCP